MGLFTRAADTFYAFRFLRLLTTPWKKMGAYKLGLIDENGKVIKKPETGEERSKYTIFHKLVFNLKRMLNKIPLGKTTLASYIAALYLIKEHTGMSDKDIAKALKEGADFDIALNHLEESRWFLSEDNKLKAGHYSLNHDVPLAKTGDMLALRDSIVSIDEDADPIGHIFGTPVYKAFHNKTKQPVYITQNNISR